MDVLDDWGLSRIEEELKYLAVSSALDTSGDVIVHQNDAVAAHDVQQTVGEDSDVPRMLPQVQVDTAQRAPVGGGWLKSPSDGDVIYASTTATVLEQRSKEATRFITEKYDTLGRVKVAKPLLQPDEADSPPKQLHFGDGSQLVAGDDVPNGGTPMVADVSRNPTPLRQQFMPIKNGIRPICSPSTSEYSVHAAVLQTSEETDENAGVSLPSTPPTRSSYPSANQLLPPLLYNSFESPCGSPCRASAAGSVLQRREISSPLQAITVNVDRRGG